MKTRLAIVALSFSISIACSASRSATTSPPGVSAPATPLAPAASSSAAQEKPTCTLKLSGAPAIEGLRLGMTQDEVLAAFPGSQDDPEIRSFIARPLGKFGTSELLIRPWKLKKETQPAVGAVTQISVILLDGHVLRLNVGYNGPRYEHVDDFINALRASKDLPAISEWQAHPGLDDQLKILACTEFDLRVNASGDGGNLNYVQLEDLEAGKKLRERRRKAREQASPTPGKQ